MENVFIVSKPTGRIPHRRTEYNGTVFDSKTEAAYAQRLDLLKHAHDPTERVVSYQTQVPYEIVIKGKKIFTYKADFKLFMGDGRVRVIDIKSRHTAKDPVFAIKKKAVEAYYDIEIEVIIP